jgi:hypothetical protein
MSDDDATGRSHRKRSSRSKRRGDGSGDEEESPDKSKSSRSKSKDRKSRSSKREKSEKSEKSSRKGSEAEADTAANDVPGLRNLAEKSRSKPKASRGDGDSSEEDSHVSPRKRISSQTSSMENPTEYALDIQDSDVASSEPALTTAAQASRFVELHHFHDGTAPEALPLDAELLHDGQRLLTIKGTRACNDGDRYFLESITTGNFRSVPWSESAQEKQDAAAGGGSGGPPETEAQQERRVAMDQTKELVNMMNRIDDTSKTLFLTAQGLMAGMSVSQVYVMEINSGEAFLRSYGTLANANRTAFYILGTVSFMAALDKYLRERSDRLRWKARPRLERWQIKLAVFIYLAILALSLHISAVDVLLNERATADYGAPDLWYRSSAFGQAATDKVSGWKAACMVRMLVCMAGWLVHCLELHQQVTRAQQLSAENDQLLEQNQTQTSKLDWLSGRQLDLLGTAELEAHVALHKDALEETQRMLGLRMQSEGVQAGGGFSPQRSPNRGTALPGR